MASGSVELLSDLFVEKVYTYAYTIKKNDSLSITADDFSMKTPDGYTAISVKRFTSGSKYVAVGNVTTSATGTTTVMLLREVGGADRSNLTARLTVVYVKSDFYYGAV